MTTEGVLGWRIGTGLTLSVAVHVVGFLSLALFPVPVFTPEAPPVSFTVMEEIPEPEPEPEVVPEPEPEPEIPEPEPELPKPPKPQRVVPVAPPEQPPPEPEDTPPAPAEESPADFTGLTLTNDGPGDGWVSAVGSGAAMTKPIGTPGAVTGRRRRGVAGGAIGGTGSRVAAPKDLSRRPVPPKRGLLDAALAKNYPKRARKQGIEGETRLKLRVLASGKLRPLATVTESFAGFAEACRKTLNGVRFGPGIDKRGQPVATDIEFTCTFTIY